jgi:hypothetical protein
MKIHKIDKENNVSIKTVVGNVFKSNQDYIDGPFEVPFFQ